MYEIISLKKQWEKVLIQVTLEMSGDYKTKDKRTEHSTMLLLTRLFPMEVQVNNSETLTCILEFNNYLYRQRMVGTYFAGEHHSMYSQWVPDIVPFYEERKSIHLQIIVRLPGSWLNDLQSYFSWFLSCADAVTEKADG